MADMTKKPGKEGGKGPIVILKVLFSLYLAVLVPFYWIHYGPQNFLWFCDAALLITLPALWLESRLLTSIAAVGIILPQILWIVDFLVQAVTGEPFLRLADYMFDDKYSLFVRGLSSFHGWLPLVLLGLMARFGYDSRALPIQSLLCWLLLIASFMATDPPPAPTDSEQAVNVNNVFGIGSQAQDWMPPIAYLGVQMLVYPLAVYFPSNFLFGRLFGRKKCVGG